MVSVLEHKVRITGLIVLFFILKLHFDVSLFHRAYFTYSLLIYPTNALHLKHSIVYV
jgi:hypothetical protein